MKLTELYLRKKNHSFFKLLIFRETMLLLYDYVGNSGSENLKHLQMNNKNMDTSYECFLKCSNIFKIDRWRSKYWQNSPLNFKPKLKTLLQKYIYKNNAKWFLCKNMLCSNLFQDLPYVYWAFAKKFKHYFLVIPSEFFMNSTLSKSICICWST